MSKSEDELMQQVARDPDSAFREKPHTGEELCESCPDLIKCEERRKTDVGQKILWAQAEHCHCVVGRQDFHPDKEWRF